MKVIVYMATTANGYIATEDDDTAFVSSVEWKAFRSMAKKFGNLIVARRTYEIMVKDEELDGLESLMVCVVTSDQDFKSAASTHYAVTSPRKALEFLKSSGYTEALVSGGGRLNASFFKESLVDELYLDIEPVLFGKGINLLQQQDVTARLKLLGTKKLSADEIQLHYQVLSSSEEKS